MIWDLFCIFALSISLFQAVFDSLSHLLLLEGQNGWTNAETGALLLSTDPSSVSCKSLPQGGTVPASGRSWIPLLYLFPSHIFLDFHSFCCKSDSFIFAIRSFFLVVFYFLYVLSPWVWGRFISQQKRSKTHYNMTKCSRLFL